MEGYTATAGTNLTAIAGVGLLAHNKEIIGNSTKGVISALQAQVDKLSFAVSKSKLLGNKIDVNSINKDDTDFVEWKENKYGSPCIASVQSDGVSVAATKCYKKGEKVEIDDYLTKLNDPNLINHVMQPGYGLDNEYEGLHSLNEIDASKYTRSIKKNINGDTANNPYTAEVGIEGPDGNIYTKGGASSTTSFFPDNWDRERILEEVKYAIENNEGVVRESSPSDGIWGYSIDGSFKIQIQYDPNNGKISFFFPLFE